MNNFKMSGYRNNVHHGLRYVAVSIAMIAVGGFVYGQSPTDTFIRVRSLKSPADLPTTKSVQRSVPLPRLSFSSKNGMIRSGAIVVAPTRSEAQSLSQRAAINNAINKVIETARQVTTLRREVASAVADLKASHARVIRERKTPQGYEAEALLERPRSQMVADFRETALSNYRIMVLLDGKSNLFEQPIGEIIRGSLSGALAEQSFTVIDAGYTQRQANFESSNDKDRAQRRGTEHLCNMVVLGKVELQKSQETLGIISFLATAQIRVIQAETGQVIVVRQLKEKGFGQDETQAARAALEALSKKAGADIPSAIASRFVPITVNIVLEEETEGEIERLAKTIQTMPGVVKVARQKSNSQRTLIVTTKDKAAYIGLRLTDTKQFEVAGYSIGKE